MTAFGEECWTTTNANYGSVVKPSALRLKRDGALTSFEMMRFLPDHPHWRDRESWGGFKTPKTTYNDLGSYYIDGRKIPAEYLYTTGKRKGGRGTAQLDGGMPMLLS